jgi:hypothetical protein
VVAGEREAGQPNPMISEIRFSQGPGSLFLAKVGFRTMPSAISSQPLTSLGPAPQKLWEGLHLTQPADGETKPVSNVLLPSHGT